MLTEAEMRLMEILWDRGNATVAEVVEALSPEASLAYTTVLTTMRILEQKGYVGHNTQGRAFIYHPVLLHIARRLPIRNDRELLDAYRRAADSIPSTDEREQALAALQ
jgi:predicted transcriptional regulator